MAMSQSRTQGLPDNQRPTTKINVGETERMVSLVGGPALALFGLSRRNPGGIALAALAGWLFYRGFTGHDPVYDAIGVNTAVTGLSDMVSVPHGHGVRVDKTVMIDRPITEVYNFWHNFENLPRFMNHLEAVQVIDDKRSHWVAKGPAGVKVEWDAEIINEVPNEVIGWRSTENSTVENAGSVRFRPAPAGHGTEVKVNLKYNPPAGKVGAAVAKLFGEEPDIQLDEDLHRLKQLMETGSASTTAGTTSTHQETR